MSILRNKYEIIDEEGNKGYTIPAVVKYDDESVPFKKAVTISTILHPGSVALVWLFVLILAYLGIHLDLFKKPEMKPKDIEFVLVDTPAPPKDPNTKNRAEMNSRTGGVRDKKRPVVLPTGQASRPSKSSASSSLQKMVQQQQKQIIKEQIQQKKAVQQKAVEHKSSAPTQSTQNRPSPKPPVARPTAAPSARPVSAPKTVAPRQTTPFAVPVPSGAPKGNYLSTGPVGGTGAKTGSYSGGASSGAGTAKHYAPTPSLSTYKGTGGNGTGASKGSGASRGTGGYVGNPGGGGGRPGIDAIKEPDFGPYMRELQRRIKLNWTPPKGNESKQVVLLFKIAKNGQLISCRVFKSSGFPAADQAALNAVKLTAPFRPLPADYKGNNIDIQFTFDYRVFGGSAKF
ncbi:MAG: TonB family protein [Candidatus Gastranaerophilales bacterium]|nr:TonB family protein [Candidatus Gastranaerophilales bacterium]